MKNTYRIKFWNGFSGKGVVGYHYIMASNVGEANALFHERFGRNKILHTKLLIDHEND